METILTVLMSAVMTMSTAVNVQWHSVLGNVSCVNAKKERHIIRGDCEVTLCSYRDRFLLFLQCGDTSLQCVQFNAEGECPAESVVY